LRKKSNKIVVYIKKSHSFVPATKLVNIFLVTEEAY
jgi:hypothetical protein